MIGKNLKSQRQGPARIERLTLALLLGALLGSIPIPANAIPDPELWSFWVTSDASSERKVDHSAWQAILDRHLRTHPKTQQGQTNLVDYDGFDAEQRNALKDYLSSLSSIDPRTLQLDEQLAYWINLYNAKTVEVVLHNPDKGSILRMGKGFFAIGPWNDKLLIIAGKSVTLNDIEHRILRPIWQDRRVHYALNCASMGCPDLGVTAYTGDNANELLNAAETSFINSDRAVHFSEDGKLRLSSLFKWYRTDFARTDAQILTYLAQHHQTQGARIAAYQRSVAYRYDWKLNRLATDDDG